MDRRAFEPFPFRQRLAWLASLGTFTRALCASDTGPGAEVAGWIVGEHWRWMEAMYRSATRQRPSEVLDSLSELDDGILGILDGAVTCGASATHAQIVAFLTSGACPFLALAGLLRRAQTNAPAGHGPLRIDAVRTRHDWPLAKDKRAHVHQVIDRHELPVTHTTRRSGRPFTLVLTKTRALFDREASERAAKQEALAQLSGATRS